MRGDDRQWAIRALRDAATTSVKDDNQLTLLEFIQNYPSEVMHVRVERIQEIQREAEMVQRRATQVQNEVESMGYRLRQTPLTEPDTDPDHGSEPDSEPGP